MPTANEDLPASPETANETEKQLIQKYIAQKKVVELQTLELKEATKLRDDYEAKLITMLKDEDKRASAKYEGLGHVTIIEGAAHASIEKGRADEVQKFLREIGREDMIKTSVAAATLSTYVRECLNENKELPPGVSFYRPEWLNFYPVKD